MPNSQDSDEIINPTVPSTIEEREQAARYIRSKFISVPAYAKKDREQGMEFWRAFSGSRACDWGLPPKPRLFDGLENPYPPILETLRRETTAHILEIVDLVISNNDSFMKWPAKKLLFMPGTLRDRQYHVYTEEQEQRMHHAAVPINTLSNGPAIAAFLLAKGERPMRTNGNNAWSVHHIYDGKFPLSEGQTVMHAVRHGEYFTEAGGLVAVHPIADGLADEVPYFSWWLRYQAYFFYDFDPMNVFSGC